MRRAAPAGAVLPGEGPQGAVEAAAAALQEAALGTREALGGAGVARQTGAVAGFTGIFVCLEESSVEREGLLLDPALRSHVVCVQDMRCLHG